LRTRDRQKARNPIVAEFIDQSLQPVGFRDQPQMPFTPG
jgi:hypothetical protein